MHNGFFFANRHSSDFWLAMGDARRPLLAGRRRNDYEISGRHGTVDFGGETYKPMPIPVEIYFISEDEYRLQVVAREIAHWLSGKGILVFDDEPDKAYDAVVYDEIDTDQIIRTKRATVVFECQPFASTINFLQSINPGVTRGHTVDIDSRGTQATPGIVILQNTGTVPITSITIIRRALRT